MIIWGWGKQTRKVIGNVFLKNCSHCNTEQMWQLCLIRTWFTLFFIPVIPYAKSYQIACPSCRSYIAITKEAFEDFMSKLSLQDSGRPAKENPFDPGKS